MINDGVISKSWKNGVEYKKREIGCYLSHYKIYNLIKESQSSSDYTIIFEDDFKITSTHFLDDIEKALDNIEDDFDMLFLGNLNNNHGVKIKDNIYYVDKNEQLIGTHAILINNKNIEKIIKVTSDIDMAIDLKIDSLVKNNKINVLVMYPTIVIQESKDSNIRNMAIETFTTRR